MRVLVALALLVVTCSAQVQQVEWADVRPKGVPFGQLPDINNPNEVGFLIARIGQQTLWQYENTSTVTSYVVGFVATLTPLNLFPPRYDAGSCGPIESRFWPDNALTPLSTVGAYPFDLSWTWTWYPQLQTNQIRITLPFDTTLLGVQFYYEGRAHTGTQTPPSGLPCQPVGVGQMITVIA